MRPFTYRLLNHSVTDGDTLSVVVDVGFGFRYETRLRLQGIDAPELHGEPRQRPAARVAMFSVLNWLEAHGKGELWCESIEWDKYGRVLGDLVDASLPRGDPNGRLSASLLRLGVVRQYGGEAKQPWTDEELAKIAGVKSCP